MGGTTSQGGSEAGDGSPVRSRISVIRRFAASSSDFSPLVRPGCGPFSIRSWSRQV
ncbi:hypothetical protein ACFPM0_36410 [Pseudonocardia sulfidoxydans]|uniref:hypothetical protein n=1 Tax=Pseudonocardia sulfidoxydans TaxID=54011 RepID=UPI00361F6BC4